MQGTAYFIYRGVYLTPASSEILHSLTLHSSLRLTPKNQAVSTTLWSTVGGFPRRKRLLLMTFYDILAAPTCIVTYLLEINLLPIAQLRFLF